jgi:hypothetical protein
VQDNRQQPGYRSFGSSEGQPHSVPQPPANERGARNPQVENSQPRYQQNQPNAGSGQFNRGGNQPVARPNNPQPSAQPARAERPAPRQESSGGGRQVQSRESGSNQQHGKQESKSDNSDKHH